MRVKITEAAKYVVNMKVLSNEAFQFFLQSFGCSRKVYNLYVDYLYTVLERMAYSGGEELPTIKFPEVKKFKEEFPYLKIVDSLALSNAKQDFEDAVKRYNKSSDHTSYTKRAKRRAESGTEPLTFRGLSGMPKFHSKAKGHFSYTTNCQYPGEGNKLIQPTIRLEGNKLHLPKLKEDVELIIHRKMP